MKHILSASQFDKDTLGDVFERADFYKKQEIDIVGRRKVARQHIGRQLCTLFYEPSTRTRLSFESAAVKLGMGLISTENAGEFSSAAKGETIEDTIRVADGYADIIVLRHPQPNTAAIAASVSQKAIINAGDGGNEHPTQAVLDTFTIKELQGGLDNLTMAFIGDLRFGRTVRSLVNIMARVYEGNTFKFIAPPELQISEDIIRDLDARGNSYTTTDDRYDGAKDADVIYCTRLQAERLERPDEIEAILRAIASGGYILDKSILRLVKPTTSILHPLPRVGEINPEIDTAPQSKFFEQAHNGVPVRQALLDMILSNEQAA